VGLSAMGWPFTSLMTSPLMSSTPSQLTPSSTTTASTSVRFGWWLLQVMAISSRVEPSGLAPGRNSLMATGSPPYTPAGNGSHIPFSVAAATLVWLAVYENHQQIADGARVAIIFVRLLAAGFVH